ncbi:hypothetical protein BKA81DRAFT_127434 [Phyllosticta paracitricarpa]
MSMFMLLLLLLLLLLLGGGAGSRDRGEAGEGWWGVGRRPSKRERERVEIDWGARVRGDSSERATCHVGVALYGSLGGCSGWARREGDGARGSRR